MPALLRSRLLLQAGANHGITHRTAYLPLHGDVSYVSGASDTKAVASNREHWSKLLGTPAHRWVSAQQVHGVNYRVVSDVEAGRGATTFEDAIPSADILISQAPGVALSMYCADCTPILLWDPVQRVAAAVHAGWRGTVKCAAGVAVAAMYDEFGSEPDDILAFIGPSIGPCCYEVGEEVVAAWSQSGVDPIGESVVRDSDRPHFNLWRANQLSLIVAGVRPERIELAGICTMCHADSWFSHRASGGTAGRFAAIIVVPPAVEHGPR